MQSGAYGSGTGTRASSPDAGSYIRVLYSVRRHRPAARRPDQELPERRLLRGDDLRGARLVPSPPAGGEREGRRRLLRRQGEREEEGGRGGGGVVLEAGPAEGEARQEDEREEDPAERPHRRRRRQPRGGVREGME